MTEARTNAREAEPSAENTAVRVRDIQDRLPQLRAKLQEYHDENVEAGFRYMPLDVLWHEGRMGDLLKPVVLASILGLAEHKRPDEKIYLHEVVLPVQDETGLQVTGAASVPFYYDESRQAYRPDASRLQEEPRAPLLSFSEAYADVWSLCTGPVQALGVTNE